MEKLKILVEKAKNRDNTAFREIFEILHARVFSYACSHMENREDAMDITQEAFIDLWKGLKNFEYRTDEEFYGFIFLVAKKKIARFYKKKRNDVSISVSSKKRKWMSGLQKNTKIIGRCLVT